MPTVDFRLQTPTGQILEPWRATAEPAMRYVLAKGVSYYRLVLPTQLGLIVSIRAAPGMRC